MNGLDVRMKSYEAVEDRTLTARLPVCIRVDGRAFHHWTRGCVKPFDEALHACMNDAATAILRDFHGVLAYHQSDEITVVLWNEDTRAEPLFGNRTAKLLSVAASVVTAAFNLAAWARMPGRPLAFFDARVFCLPSIEEAANMLLWRERDATRNSLSALAHAHFSHKALHGKNSSDMHEMLHGKGINWAALPDHQKRGAYLVPRIVKRALTTEERERIPEDHRPPIGMLVERGEIARLSLPPLERVANRPGVLFRSEEAVECE